MTTYSISNNVFKLARKARYYALRATWYSSEAANILREVLTIAIVIPVYTIMFMLQEICDSIVGSRLSDDENGE